MHVSLADINYVQILKDDGQVTQQIKALDRADDSRVNFSFDPKKKN